MILVFEHLDRKFKIKYTFLCSSATHVQNEDGSVVLLSAHNPRQRSAIAKKLLTPSKESSFGGASKKVWLASQEGKGEMERGRGRGGGEGEGKGSFLKLQNPLQCI